MTRDVQALRSSVRIHRPCIATPGHHRNAPLVRNVSLSQEKALALHARAERDGNKIATMKVRQAKKMPCHRATAPLRRASPLAERRAPTPPFPARPRPPDREREAPADSEAGARGRRVRGQGALGHGRRGGVRGQRGVARARAADHSPQGEGAALAPALAETAPSRPRPRGRRWRAPPSTCPPALPPERR